MSTQIQDGTGKSYFAGVDTNGRLQVKSISEGFNVDAAINGENYNINTGRFNLTSDSKSSILYLKNNEDKDFIIQEILVIVGESTGGSGDFKIDIIKNPTAGTIVSSATDADIVENRNFGSARQLIADVYKGAEGRTITDGSVFAESLRSAATAVSFDADVIILEKSNSIGVEITPQSGNTSTTVSVAVVGFLFNGESS